MEKNIENLISSLAVSPQSESDTGYKDIFYQLEQLIGADVNRVQELVQNNVITQEQGQYLYNQLLKKAQLINNYKLAQQSNVSPAIQAEAPDEEDVPEESPMDLFNKERPGFFEASGRGDILNYIKDFDMDKDEIVKIAQLIEALEHSAVDNYLKKSEYEKSLNDENAIAKSRLSAYAQKPASDGNMVKVFTREEIGKMSGKEFTQNEDAIMAQLKKGLIK
ncbi:hypothetical protein IKR55_04890 [bacterium]|nr:hypothetical protein [bacterium]